MMPDVPQPQSDRELPHVPLSAVMREWRWLIAGCVVAGVLVGLAVTGMRPDLFAATATLHVTSVDASPEGNVAAMTNARTLFENRSLAAAVIARYNLDKPPESLTPERLVRDRLAVAPIRDTEYMRVTLRLRSRESVDDALQQWLAAGIDLNAALALQDTKSGATTLLKHQLEEARAQLATAREKLRAARQSVQLEQVRADVDLSLAQRARVWDLATQIAGERARLARTEQQLAGRTRVLSVPRYARGEGALFEYSRRITEAAETASRQEARQVAGDRRLGDEPGSQPEPGAPAPEREPEPPMPVPRDNAFIDPVYEVLDYQVASSRAKLAALEAQRAAMLKSGDPDLQRLYFAQMTLGQLEVDQELAVGTYKRLAERYNAAREAAVGRSPQLQVADPPVLLADAASPRGFLNAAVGGLIGLLCAAGIVFLRWRSAPAAAPAA